MAFVLKNGQVLSAIGGSFDSAHMVVNASRLVYQAEIKYVCVEVQIFGDSNIERSRANMITSIRHEFKGDNFDTYFAESVIKVAGNSFLTQAYKAILAAQYDGGENEEDGSAIMVDRIDKTIWESDE